MKRASRIAGCLLFVCAFASQAAETAAQAVRVFVYVGEAPELFLDESLLLDD